MSQTILMVVTSHDEIAPGRATGLGFEEAVELVEAMPFLLEDRLRELGGEVTTAEDWADHVVVDGKLVTGQNTQSSRSVAEATIRLLRQPET